MVQSSHKAQGPENNITEATEIYGMNHKLYTEVSRHHNTAHMKLHTEYKKQPAKEEICGLNDDR